MQKLALLTGYTPSSASVTFGTIKRKLKALGDAAGPATPKNGSSKASTTTPSRSGAKRAAKPAADDTPSKRAKKTAPAPPHKAKHPSAQDAAAADDDDELFAPAIKKEEVLELNVGANLYFDQLQSAAAGYDPRAREKDVD
jgi:hypothetical protein